MKPKTTKPYGLPDILLDTVPDTCDPLPLSVLFITSEEWTRELLKHQSCDVITYTISRFFPVAIRRCICSRHQGHTLNEKFKVRQNIHAKLYIGYTGDTPTAAYIGSANAVRPTAEELLYRLPQDDLGAIVDYYDQIWNTI